MSAPAPERSEASPSGAQSQSGPYWDGYREGHDDGYMGREHRMLFPSYTHGLGYRAGFDAGNATRVFARHAREAEGAWCSTCGKLTNHRTLAHTTAMEAGR